MTDEKKHEEKKPATRAQEFVPRRLVVITGGPRGDYLADADTGEDLRLPVQNLRVEWSSSRSHADCSFLVVGFRQWRGGDQDAGQAV